MPGLTRRLSLTVPATLVAAVLAAAPAGAATHAKQPGTSNAGIVDIYTTLGYEQGELAGTGMILTRSGEVLTNNHVIRGGTSFKAVDVTTHRTYTATVVGYSVAGDVAVLQVAQASGLRTMPLAGSLVRVGQRVVAHGNAGGRGGTPATAAGKVVALHRTIVAQDDTGGSETLINMIATDARIRAGDSGGPLENAKGRAIGMITAGSTRRGFAIPIRHALNLARLIEAGTASPTVHVGDTAFLGVSLQDANAGAAITAVVSGSAAATAGLAAGDVITSLAGEPIASSADVQKVILSLAPGTAISIGWTDSGGAAQTGTITPDSGPPQ